MKYRMYALPLLLLYSYSYAQDVSGKSVFVDFMNYDLYGTTGYTLIAHQEHEKGHVINKPELLVSLFGGKTSKDGQDALRRYLLFNNKTELTVKEEIPDTAAKEFSQDILSGDFNLETNTGDYHSRITVNPKQTTLGFVLSYRHPFKEKYWVSVDAPFLHLKQSVGLTETRVSAASPRDDARAFYHSGDTSDRLQAQVNMREAFRQPGLKYGRIDGMRKKDGMADLKLRFGRNAIDREDLFISQYLGVIIPTGNRRTAEYMWEPIVGNGHHAGIEWGSTVQICMHEANACNWWVTNALTGHYLFENTQKRSLDLYNGQWTRYLAMYENEAARVEDRRTFGINNMTQDVRVSPGVAFGMATQLSMVSKKWNINLGIINRFRQAEEVELAQAWKLGPMISNVSTANEAVPVRRMGQAHDADYLVIEGNVPIQASNIDLNSAAHPSVIMSTLHTSVAYFNDGEFSQNYEVGASYDTSRQNAGISRWNLYGKLLISF